MYFWVCGDGQTCLSIGRYSVVPLCSTLNIKHSGIIMFMSCVCVCMLGIYVCGIRKRKSMLARARALQCLAFPSVHCSQSAVVLLTDDESPGQEESSCPKVSCTVESQKMEHGHRMMYAALFSWTCIGLRSDMHI